jgi:hypothetical protein
MFMCEDDTFLLLLTLDAPYSAATSRPALLTCVELRGQCKNIFSLEGFTLPETQLESVLQVLFMVSNSPLTGGKARSMRRTPQQRRDRLS